MPMVPGVVQGRRPLPRNRESAFEHRGMRIPTIEKLTDRKFDSTGMAVAWGGGVGLYGGSGSDSFLSSDQTDVLW